MSPLIQTISLTTMAMIAFAANSVLTRLALAPNLIDAASFSVIRIGSGALILWLIFAFKGGLQHPRLVDPAMILSLFVYVVGFSFAYITLGAGSGALILFASVQITMLSWAFMKGERFRFYGWIGLFMAVSGLAYLMLPGATAPDLFGTGLMVSAGIAWGIYSLRGRQAGDPLRATAWNFLFCLPLCIGVWLFFSDTFHLNSHGIGLAIASGALASGLGYVVWYAALPLLQARHASVVQLSVPVIAALGGTVFINEPFTLQLFIASLLTLSGIALIIFTK